MTRDEDPGDDAQHAFSSFIHSVVFTRLVLNYRDRSIWDQPAVKRQTFEEHGSSFFVPVEPSDVRIVP